MTKLHPSLENKEFWYRDIEIKPNSVPSHSVEEIDLTSNATRHLRIKTPLISSPMDTVTEGATATALTSEGGLGIIHANLSLDELVREIEIVRRFESAFVKDPICLKPSDTVADIFKVHDAYGFWSVLVTETGKPGSTLLGVVTHRDVRYYEPDQEDQMAVRLNDIMTPRGKLTVGYARETLDKNDVRAANRLIRFHKLDMLPIVDDDFLAISLVTDSDLRKNEKYPLATKDANDQLIVFFAVTSFLERAIPRIEAGYAAGGRGIVIDSAVMHKAQIDIARYCREKYPDLAVIVGNVASKEVIRELFNDYNAYECIDGIRVNISSGSICITTEAVGVGRPPGSAVYECSQELRRIEKEKGYKEHIPIIADGSLSMPGEIILPLALGADSVMSGRLFAGTYEAPGEFELQSIEDENGRVRDFARKKEYRGMGSAKSMNLGSAARYGISSQKARIPEGIVEYVFDKGSIHDLIRTLYRPAILQGLLKTGCQSIEELHERAYIVPR